MDRNGMSLTVVFIVLALVIIGVFLYRIRVGTFKKHIMAEAAIVISFVVVSIAADNMLLAVRLVTPAAVIGVFVYGRRKND